MCLLLLFFFFSSRRRHTRFDCDWSSDVCSSDLSFQSRRPQRRSRKLRQPLKCFKHEKPPGGRLFPRHALVELLGISPSAGLVSRLLHRRILTTGTLPCRVMVYAATLVRRNVRFPTTVGNGRELRSPTCGAPLPQHHRAPRLIRHLPQ